MAEEKSEENKIDWFSPEIVTAFVTAAIGDLFFWVFFIPHYIAGIIVLAIVWPKTKGFLAHFALFSTFLVPLPFLMIGIWQAIFLSNKLIAMIAEQVAIQAIAVATAGAGEALEVGAVAAEGAEVAATAAEAAEAAEAVGAAAETAEAVEAAGGAAEAAGAAEGGVEAGAEAGGEAAEAGEAGGAPKREIEPEALGEERPLLGEEGQLQKELLEEAPPEGGAPPEAEEEAPKPQETEAERKLREAQERAEKIKKWMERIRPKEEEEGGEEEAEENEEGGDEQGDLQDTA